jgi:Undecaprenyl-phosphate galactose phosphotransferase WbaP
MLALAAFISFYLKKLLNPDLPPVLYQSLWPAFLPFIVFYAFAHLYPVVAMNPVEELRLLTGCTSLVYLALAAFSFLLKDSELYSRQVFFVGWLLSAIMVPTGRAIVRYFASSRPWWQQPAFILGAGKTGEMVVRELQRQKGLGIRPLAIFDDDPAKHGELLGIPVVGDVDLAWKMGKEMNVSYCIMAMPGVTSERQLELLELYDDSFTHFLVIPDLFGFSTLRVPSRDLGGILSLEIQQQLLMPVPRFFRRMGEIILTILGGIIVLPFILLTAFLIVMTTPGPAFFGHTRIGRRGRRFKAWKFRSMYQDADKRLKECLAKSPEMRKEWQENQKLRNDPRITPIGALLRRTSMDELPQIWNVLKGDMCLVGPRPIVESEIEKYGHYFRLYLKVTPGMTGLWQVSGRSDTTYHQRVMLDTYYVRNWSLWLDIYIMVRTVRVVLVGSGAR